MLNEEGCSFERMGFPGNFALAIVLLCAFCLYSQGCCSYSGWPPWALPPSSPCRGHAATQLRVQSSSSILEECDPKRMIEVDHNNYPTRIGFEALAGFEISKACSQRGHDRPVVAQMLVVEGMSNGNFDGVYTFSGWYGDHPTYERATGSGTIYFWASQDPEDADDYWVLATSLPTLGQHESPCTPSATCFAVARDQPASDTLSVAEAAPGQSPSIKETDAA